jgi:hypothetical protein
VSDWLPEGVTQASVSSFSPPLEGGREKEEPVTDVDELRASFKWSAEFWHEPEAKARELIREDLLIYSQINVFPGLFEHGKTMVVGDLACKWARNHGPVLYLDWEMGARRVKRRMKAHGLTLELAQERWNYRSYPQLAPTQLAMWADVLGPNLLVVMDSWHKAMAALGMRENDADSAGAWWGQELRPLTDLGATVAVIAQTTKQGGAARGTAATAFDSDVIWQVERFKKFTPDEAGMIRLTQEKDREGVLPPRVAFALGGDGENRIVLRPVDPDDVPKGEPAVAALLELIVDLLEGPEAEARGGLATSAIVKSIEGYGEGPIKTALDQLEADDRIEHYMNTGTGGGVKWRLAQAIAVPDAPPLD